MQSVSHSASLMNCDYEAYYTPYGLMTQIRKSYRLHIVLALGSINNNVTKNNDVCVKDYKIMILKGSQSKVDPNTSVKDTAFLH